MLTAYKHVQSMSSSPLFPFQRPLQPDPAHRVYSSRMTREEERNLIQRVQRGDRAAAEALIRAQQQSLFAYMLRMSGNRETAEDITQAAFVRALANIDRFDTRYRFSTWLFTIAKRLHMNLCD